MIKTEYKRDMERNYVILREEVCLEKGYFLKLLQNNSIEGILPLELRTIDTEIECFWEITGKQSLKMIIERGGIDKEFLEEIIEKLHGAIKNGENYLLKQEDYVLSSETIFLDKRDFSLYLCYVPGYQKTMEEQWKEFTEYLMNAVDYKKEDLVLYVYGLYKAARQPEGFCNPIYENKNETEFKRTVSKEVAFEQSGFDAAKEEPIASSFMPEFEERIETDETIEKYPKKLYFLAALLTLAGLVVAAAGLYVLQPEPLQAGAFIMIVGAITIYGGSRLFSPENKELEFCHQVEYVPASEEKVSDGVFEWEKQEEERTMILAMESDEKNCFLRAEDNRKYQDIELIEFPFFFGKLRTQVNSMIESPAVSRFHAKIECLGGEYYLVDLNSTNGTYLNGEKIKAHERKRLEPMDKIRFADVGYYFETV